MAFEKDSLFGIEEYSHAEILFDPVLHEFLPRTPVRQPQWVTELMKEYWQKLEAV